jgi:hypothetical protein
MPSYDELDALTTDELRGRAFELAQRRRDVGFFWDLIKHLPASAALAGEDGSPGQLVGSIAELVRLAHEVFASESADLGQAEPLIRERFTSYLIEHG